MRVELRSIIAEIENAQRIAKLAGRSVETVWLTTPEEVDEFKHEFGRLFPDSEDRNALFTSETFWKGTRIRCHYKGNTDAT